MSKKYFTVTDLFEIRYIAQELLKEHPEWSNEKAVRVASDRVRYKTAT